MATSANWADRSAAGRNVSVIDPPTPPSPAVSRTSVPSLGWAFDPKGRRLACATYGGVMLWFARIAEQKPVALKCRAISTWTLSPDGRFLVSAMQENDLHGWRVADGKDMRMSGYPSKVRSMAFLSAR